jgi:hypothetical protein
MVRPPLDERIFMEKHRNLNPIGFNIVAPIGM